MDVTPTEYGDRKELFVGSMAGRIEPVQTSLQCKIALLLAALIMIRLPLIYIGIACAFFIDRLCDAVHAPRPRRIDVDCQVNASAGFRRGMLSMLLGRDPVLTIGLPFVAGMNARQFAGILAHEFGHFAQGGGIRLIYVIRPISFWFTRVVYERCFHLEPLPVPEEGSVDPAAGT